MQRGVADAGAPPYKTVGSRVRRHAVENAAQDAGLDAAQSFFRNFQQAHPAAFLRQPAVMVVLQRRLRFARRSPAVGKPVDGADRLVQPGRQRAQRRQVGKGQRGQPRRRRWPERRISAVAPHRRPWRRPRIVGGNVQRHQVEQDPGELVPAERMNMFAGALEQRRADQPGPWQGHIEHPQAGGFQRILSGRRRQHGVGQRQRGKSVGVHARWEVKGGG